MYHAVLSAIEVIFIPTTNLGGEHHYCSHFQTRELDQTAFVIGPGASSQREMELGLELPHVSVQSPVPRLTQHSLDFGHSSNQQMQA